MNNYRVLQVQPTTHQLQTFVAQKLSEPGRKSLAFLAVQGLFESSEALYRTLDHYTSQNLAVFTDSGRYLSTQQEHDLMALTAHYAVALQNTLSQRLVDQDTSLSDSDRVVLKKALTLYKTTAEATAAALGSPR